LAAVIDLLPGVDLLCFLVDVVRADGARPRSLDDALERRRDLLYANHTRQQIAAVRERAALRQAVARLGGLLSAQRRKDPEVAALLAAASAAEIDLVEIAYDPPTHEAALKMADFSRLSLSERWQSGRADARAALGAAFPHAAADRAAAAARRRG
jgi:NTE family protein